MSGAITDLLRPKKTKDLTWKVFGRLTAIAIVGIRHNNALWLCLCSCGRSHLAEHGDLTRGQISSCGCYRSELSKNRVIGTPPALKHGQKGTPEYKAYHHAKGRCRNTKDKIWENYGGRGIEFKFESFEQWFVELGPKPLPSHSVDRIDNDGHYEPGNVRWATRSEQNGNQRRWRRANGR